MFVTSVTYYSTDWYIVHVINEAHNGRKYTVFILISHLWNFESEHRTTTVREYYAHLFISTHIVILLFSKCVLYLHFSYLEYLLLLDLNPFRTGHITLSVIRKYAVSHTYQKTLVQCPDKIK